jgi:hypothetical protein
MKEFFQQPTWLTLKIWNHYQVSQSKVLQQQSISVAKLTNCIVNIANSFGGDNKKTIKLDEFTLYKFSMFDENSHVSDDGIDIFNQCKNKKIIPDYVLRVFADNENFIETIKKED